MLWMTEKTAMYSYSLGFNLPPFLVSLHLPSLLFSLHPSSAPLSCPKLWWSSSSTGTLMKWVTAPAQRNKMKARGWHVLLPGLLAHQPDCLLCNTQASRDEYPPPTPGHPAGLPVLPHSLQPPGTWRKAQGWQELKEQFLHENIGFPFRLYCR